MTASINIPAGFRTTAGQRTLIDAVNAALEAGWEAVPGAGLCVRFTEVVQTPAGTPERLCSTPTFERHAFVTIVTAQDRPWSVMVANANVPWRETVESRVSVKRAVEVLGDPGALWR